MKIKTKSGQFLSIIVWSVFIFFMLINPAMAANNIALHASYTLEPAPNYTADTGTHLTDGIYSSNAVIWVDSNTVGWVHTKYIIVTIDLGSVKPISGISYSTGAGTADVNWPGYIYLYAANEDRLFYEVGELVFLSNAANGAPSPYGSYSTFKFSTNALRTYGRYIALAFKAEPYAVTDEIEVYEGDQSWINLPRVGAPTTDIRQYMVNQTIKNSIKRLMHSDIASIRAKLNKDYVVPAVRSSVESELGAVETDINNISIASSKNFKAILPLNSGHERIFRAQAQLWQAKGCPSLTVWNSGLWDPLSQIDDPPQSSNGAVDIYMMSNEYRAGSFNISNTTQLPMTVSLKIIGMPGGINPSYITVHQVEWTDTKEGIPVLAALPEVALKKGAYQIKVYPGLTRQVWLTFHPTNVAAGAYTGQIRLKAGAYNAKVSLNLKLYPIRFPNQPTLHFGGFDDVKTLPPFYAVTHENEQAYIDHLIEHFVDMPTACPQMLPMGTYDTQGNMLTAPDTVIFDSWLEKQFWPGAHKRFIFINAGDKIAQFSMGTPEFNKAVGNWITFWSNRAAEKGVDPNNISMLISDEPRDNSPDIDRIITAWASAFHNVNAAIKVWEDPIYTSINNMQSISHQAMAACDVICPNRVLFLRGEQALRDYYVGLQQKGADLEFYSCSGPSRLLDPYSYYRLQAWTCWQYGAKAMQFWAFGQAGSDSSWNEYIGNGTEYTPFFIEQNSITAGKEMEACREGIEDFEYFVMLRDAVDFAVAHGLKGDTLERARKLLAELPNSVALAAASNSSYLWHEKPSQKIDRSLADKGRKEILQALTDLNSEQTKTLDVPNDFRGGAVLLDERDVLPQGVNLDLLTDWDIVVAEDAIPSELYAASEFQSYYKQAGDINLPIVKSTDRADRHIFIGSSKMMRNSKVGFSIDGFGPEDLRIIVRNNNIAIAGGQPRGTLYGVYTFLEDYLGVRFLTPDHTYVPKLKEWQVIAPVDRFYHPPLAYRFSNYSGTEYSPEFATRARANHHDHGSQFGGKSGLTLVNHTFYEVMPTSKYGKEHPEYYSMIDGKRKSQVENDWYETQLCLTNPDVLKIITNQLLEELKDHPEIESVVVGQNDSLIDVNNYCQCPNCAAIDNREGTPMGSLLNFVNAVADEVAKSHPSVMVGTMAYHHTRKPPRTIKPRENVRIQLCSIECCVMHPINDSNCLQNVDFYKDLSSWSKICKNISIWNYNANFSDHSLPCPNLRVIGPNILYFVANNARGIFMEGIPYDTAALSDLRTYITMNLLWNPNREGEQLMNEFLGLHYGQAAPPILRYINLIHDNAEKRNLHYGCFGKAADYGIDESISNAGLEAFKEAMSLADNETIHARVEKLSIGAYKAAIEPIWYVQDKAELEKLDSKLIDRMRPLAKTFFELCEKYEKHEKRPSAEEEYKEYYLIKKRLTELLNI